jgi:hypothetical protein
VDETPFTIDPSTRIVAETGRVKLFVLHLDVGHSDDLYLSRWVPKRRWLYSKLNICTTPGEVTKRWQEQPMLYRKIDG